VLCVCCVGVLFVLLLCVWFCCVCFVMARPFKLRFFLCGCGGDGQGAARPDDSLARETPRQHATKLSRVIIKTKVFVRIVINMSVPELKQKKIARDLANEKAEKAEAAEAAKDSAEAEKRIFAKAQQYEAEYNAVISFSSY
jgi:hypothetical protein